MLEAMRRHSRSLIIYLIFGILIAVFIVSFGPQSGQAGSCSQASSHVAKIDGREISEESWRFALLMQERGNASGDKARDERIRERVMDGLIEREILAQAAEARGFRIDDAEVEDRVVKGEFYVMGQRRDGRRYYYRVPEKKPGDTVEIKVPIFNDEALAAVARNYGLGGSEQFMEEQRREMLAQKMRELLAASIRVSPEEIQHVYETSNTVVAVELVKFDPSSYRDQVEVTDADIDAYIAAHDAELTKAFEDDRKRYEKRGREVRLRHIFVTKGEETPPPPAPAPAPGGATPTPPPAPAPAPDPKRAKAEAALSRIKAKPGDFAKIAREVSEDPITAKRGGLAKWRTVKALGYGDEFAAAVEKLEVGKLSDQVIVSPRGYHIVRVEGRRGEEGKDLTYKDVARELAEEALLEEKAKAAAQAAAQAALDAAKAGTPLDKQFPDEPADDAATPDPTKPKLIKDAEIRRSGKTLEYGRRFIGESAELVKALFTDLTPGSLVPKVYDLQGAFVVLRLVRRDEPDMVKFQTEKDQYALALMSEKAQEIISAFEAQTCNEKKDGISVEKRAVEYPDTDVEGKPKRPQPLYVPCSSPTPFLPPDFSPFDFETN